MSEFSPQSSSQQSDIPLTEWLWQLFDKNPAKRDQAVEFLKNTKQLERSVQDAVNSTSFKIADFATAASIYALIVSEHVLNHFSNQLGNKPQKTFWIDKLRSQPKEPIQDVASRISRSTPFDRSETEVQQGTARLKFWLTHFSQPEYDVVHSWRKKFTTDFLMHQVVLKWILDSLSSEFLAAPEVLQLMLQHPTQSEIAYRALFRIGPPAVSFAGNLLDQAKTSPRLPPWLLESLGSMARNNSELIASLLEMLGSANNSHVASAIEAFIHVGPELGDGSSQVLDQFKKLISQADNLYGVIDAYASVGRHDSRMRQQIYDLATPREPRWKSTRCAVTGELETYDAALFTQGNAIMAIRFFKEYPEESVPVLMQCLDTFEEQDSDWQYQGPGERIAHVLKNFGPAAGPAAHKLALKLKGHDSGSFMPTSICETLAAMGHSGATAIPILEALRDDFKSDEDPGPIPDKNGDLIGWTIYHIQGSA